jgi:putative endonuclease
VRWYQRHGYEIIERNWRVAFGEIDIVLRHENTIIFAEVKTRANDAFGEPSSAVNFAKQRRLRRLAVSWLSTHNVHNNDLRFDVVSVLGVRVSVVEGAF